MDSTAPWLLTASLLLMWTHIAAQHSGDELVTQAVVGATARLQCDIQPPDPCDEVHLVIWFKEGHKGSIYSFDARGRPLDRAEQTTDIDLLEGRAFFRHRDTPAVLAIDNVRLSDAGSYRCRVDYGKSPTRNYRLQLSVVVPPEKLVITNDDGSFVLGNSSRPYNEGTSAQIKCAAVGGDPLPRVTWWRGGSLLDDSYNVSSRGLVENTLVLERLGREYHRAVLTCEASNNNQLMPLRRDVLVDMNLKPVAVRLLGRQHALSAETEYKIQCEVVGSSPAPMVAWYLGGVPLDSYRVLPGANGSIAVSTLHFTPTVNDSGKVLTCRAFNAFIADSNVEDKWTLDVHFSPVAKLKSGAAGERQEVREGSSVHFDCSVKSNPWVSNVIWQHNGRRLYNNSTLGVAVGNQSLVLHSVSRQRSGSYTCVAENTEGYGQSNAVHLDVRYAPVCQSEQPRVVGVSRHAETHIACAVSANPQDVSFSWVLNTTGQSLEESFSNATHSSVTLPQGLDVVRHTLLCAAHNDVGLQRQPCVFLLLPAEAPDAVGNCSLLERSAGSVALQCSRGFDGNLPQQFTADVWRQDSGSLVATVTRHAPTFHISDVDTDVALNVSVYAFNSEGRSDVVTLLLPPTAHQPVVASASVAAYVAPVFGSLAAVVVVLGSVVAAVVILRRCEGDGGGVKGKPECSTIFGTPEDQFYTVPLRPDCELEPDVIPVRHGVHDPLTARH